MRKPGVPPVVVVDVAEASTEAAAAQKGKTKRKQAATQKLRRKVA